MVKTASVSFADWVYDEILAPHKNKSALIEEALIKLHMEKIAKIQKKEEPIAGPNGISVRSPDFFESFIKPQVETT